MYVPFKEIYKNKNFTVLLINCSVVCVDTVFMSGENFIPGRGGITSTGDYCTGEDDSL